MTDDPVPTLAPLGVPAYRRMWGAATVSHVGTFLQLVAAPWLMLDLTGSPFLVSVVTAALTMPRLLLTVPAGAIADMVDRRNLLLVGQSYNAVVVGAMAVLTWQGLMTPVVLVTLSFALGVGTAVNLPAYQTLVPDLVDRPLVPAAVTLNSAGFNVARALGPALGGAMVAAGRAELAFAANAASYLAIVAVLATFQAEGSDDDREPVWHAAATGFRYARYTRPILVILLVTAGFSITAISVQTLLPNLTADDLGAGAGGFGLLYGLFGGGALVGALTRERVRNAVRGERMLPGAIAGFGLAGMVVGLAPTPLVAGLGLAVAGAFWVWTLTTLNATVQLLAPRWVRSRVVSLYLLAFAGIMPLGSLLAGAVGEWLGAGNAITVLTAGTVTLGLASTRLRLPVLGEIREPATPDDLAIPVHAEEVAGSPVLVVTTWEVDPADLEDFAAVLRELRRQRMRTGARRWSVFRDADRPTLITEVVEVMDWDEHLRQHGRIDTEAADVIRRARAFDRAGGPQTRHLAGVALFDASAPPIEEQLRTVHADLHARDGSIPLPADHHAGDGAH